MNYDGKAFVKNVSANFFASHNDIAFVRDIKEQSVNNLCLTKGRDIALIAGHMTNTNDLGITDKTYSSGLIPYTVQVYNEEELKELDYLKFNIVRDAQVHKEQEINYNSKVYVASVQPTNIRYNPKSAIVYDTTVRESQFAFSGVTVNVNSKTEIVIPEKTTTYTDLSILVQKNSFVEIKIPENVSSVSNLPEELTHLPGYIKGTFTKSGEYNISIKYQDGEQILNIVVPYYQRLL